MRCKGNFRPPSESHKDSPNDWAVPLTSVAEGDEPEGKEPVGPAGCDKTLSPILG